MIQIKEGAMKTMLCSSCGYPVNKDKDRIVVSTFTGVTHNVRWYCPADCGNGGLKGIVKKARQLLRVG